MAYEIVMPQLSDSMEEGRLISWKVKPGDRVKTGDVIAEVESDKAIMEIQSFKDGTVKALKLKEGEDAPVGSVIALIDTEGSQSEESAAASTEVQAERTSQQTQPSEQEVTTQEQQPAESIIFKSEETQPPAQYKERSETRESRMPTPVDYPHGDQSGVASPKARALAAAKGIDIEALQLSGRLPTPAHEHDIEEVVRSRYFTPKAWQLLKSYDLSADLFGMDHKHNSAEIEEYIAAHGIARPLPLTPNQKAVIQTVEASARKPVYHIYDTISLEHIRKYETKEITVTVLLLKLFGEAMMRHEAMRTTLGTQGLQVSPNASISLAMADGTALYMPVIKAIERMSLSELAAVLTETKTAVKSGKLSAQMLKGSTFGLSNLGMTGIARFDAMINADDAGIAAIGSPDAQGFVAVTLTLDHRIVNGFQGAEFMQTLKALAQDVLWMVHDGTER